MLHALLVVMFLLSAPGTPVQPGEPASPTPVRDELKDEAAALRPLVTTDLAKAFLAAVQQLPEPGETIVYRSQDGRSISPQEYDALPPAQQETFSRRVLQPRFFYATAYGTPLLYTRALDLLASRDPSWTPDKLEGKRVLDFGCGTIGHLRLLAALGVEATGVDVEPLFGALYGQPGTQGPVQTDAGARGFARVLIGRWPAQEAIVEQVRSHGPYDLFISKNTLKRGYIHPARPADPNRLVHLGVEDDEFLTQVHDSLKPGGVFLIYNICPAQADENQPYLPHADGQCPFDRAALEKAGFEVLVFDETDHEKIVEYWHALGLNQAKPREETAANLFAWWTMCRRPVGKAAGESHKPQVARNFAAEFNETIAKIPPEQRAWQLYREALMKLVPVSEELNELGWPAFPDEAHWDLAVANLRENAAMFARLRDAADRPMLGVPMSDAPDPVIARFDAERNGEKFQECPPSADPALLDVLMHHVGYFRHFVRMLVMDSRDAYVAGDADRVVANCRAIAGIARHAAQFPSLISARASVAMHLQAVSIAGEMLESRAGLLSNDQLRDLRSDLEELDYNSVVLEGLRDEREYFHDFVRRAYSDDAGGDGVLTPEGWKRFDRVAGDQSPTPVQIREHAAGRAATIAKFDEVMSATVAAGRGPMWEWNEAPEDVQERLLMESENGMAHLVTRVLFPDAGKALFRSQRAAQARDAVCLAIAMELNRRERGGYPDTLGSLVPEFIGRLPTDRMDGTAMKYRLVDGSPVVYSVGLDRDDDNGRAALNPFFEGVWLSEAEVARRRETVGPKVPDGDDVLWPTPKAARTRP